MLEEWVTQLSVPCRGAKLCVHICSNANGTCAPGTPGCTCALPRGYTVSGVPAANVLISDDCSGVPAAAKSWSATQRAPEYWRFASADGTCLTVNRGDVINKWYTCGCSLVVLERRMMPGGAVCSAVAAQASPWHTCVCGVSSDSSCKHCRIGRQAWGCHASAWLAQMPGGSWL